MRKAFTLIEILLAVSILSIMMLFLYQSYSSLNLSNRSYKNELGHIRSNYLTKKMLFLDFSLAHKESIKILNQSTTEDVVFMQSSNSIHKRHNPYIAYIIQDSKLYRLESIHEFKNYPLSIGGEYVADLLGEIKSFRIYPSKDEKTAYLVHIDFKEDQDILLKIRPLMQ